LEEARQITWGWRFIGGPAEEDPQSEGYGGYHYEETVIISDSEDDLFFLDGELPATCHCK